MCSTSAVNDFFFLLPFLCIITKPCMSALIFVCFIVFGICWLWYYNVVIVWFLKWLLFWSLKILWFDWMHMWWCVDVWYSWVHRGIRYCISNNLKRYVCTCGYGCLVCLIHHIMMCFLTDFVYLTGENMNELNYDSILGSVILLKFL